MAQSYQLPRMATQSAEPLNVAMGRGTQKSMLAALINLAAEASGPHVRLHHKRNVGILIRRIKILGMLFEELSLSEDPLPPSAWLCLREITIAINRAKLLLENFSERSSTWQILYSNITLSVFQELAQAMANALDILPLQLLDIPEELKEQLELVHMQLRRGKVCDEPCDSRIRIALLSAIQDMERLADCDVIKMKWILDTLHMNTPSDCLREIQLLEKEITVQAGTGGLVVISTISKLITFLCYAKCMFFGQEPSQDDHEEPSNFTHSYTSLNPNPNPSCSSHCIANFVSHVNRAPNPNPKTNTNPNPNPKTNTNPNPNPNLDDPTTTLTFPDEFRCPISLDLMRDPVIVATGHTYERASIAKWLESGHSTCPKSGQKLLHISLIPNYVLRSLIAQWCAEHDISFESAESIKNVMDHIEHTQGAFKDAKLTAAFLVGKLATGAPDIQRQVAYELRLLAKSGTHNRMCIAEAGAIPFLIPLLSSKDPKTQEHAITALLNVSIYEHNKALIMAAGALDAIVQVLKDGSSMESRENAAATLFSLSVVNEYKVAIGNTPHAIPCLVELLMQGSTRGKKDAATALFNLSIFQGNKAKVVHAGAIHVLVNLLTDETAGITDDALAVLAILAPCAEGLNEIKNTRAIPLLVDLLGFGSMKGKENSTAVLLALCRSGGEEMTKCVLSISSTLPHLERLAANGSPRAKRKAYALMKILLKPQSPHAEN